MAHVPAVWEVTIRQLKEIANGYPITATRPTLMEFVYSVMMVGHYWTAQKNATQSPLSQYKAMVSMLTAEFKMSMVNVHHVESNTP